jgi:arsenical pump membrane protein
MSASQSVLAWSIAGVLFRPKEWPEAVWACLGAFLMVACGLISPGAALGAMAKGTDVYLFLTGGMLCPEWTCHLPGSGVSGGLSGCWTEG